MANPKMTTADLEGIPRCPHCEADMLDATFTLEALMDDWCPTKFIHVDDDGYVHPGDHLATVCLSCHKVSGVSFHGNQVKLVAMRTEVDERYRQNRCAETMEMFE